MSVSEWADMAGKWYTENVTVDNILDLTYSASQEILGGINSLGAGMAYSTIKGIDYVGDSVGIDITPAVSGIYNQYEQSWIRNFNENPVRQIALVAQGGINAVASTVFIADLGYFVAADLIVHPAIAAVYNLGADDDNKMNYMTDKPFGSWGETATYYTQIDHYVPKDWEYLSKTFAPIDWDIPDAIHESKTLFGAQALGEVPLFYIAATKSAGAISSAASTVKRSLGAKAVQQVKNADLLDDFVKKNKALEQAEKKLGILKNADSTPVDKITAATTKLDEAQDALTQSNMTLRRDLNLDYISKNEIAGNTSKAADEVEEAHSKLTHLQGNGGSAKDIARASNKLSEAQTTLNNIDIKADAIKSVRELAKASNGDALNLGAKLTTDTPNLTQHFKNSWDLGQYKGDTWLNPKHGPKMEAAGAGFLYVMSVKTSMEQGGINKQNDADRVEEMNNRHLEGLKTSFKDSSAPSSQYNNGAISPYSCDGSNATANTFNCSASGTLIPLPDGGITITMTPEAAAILDASLGSKV